MHKFAIGLVVLAGAAQAQSEIQDAFDEFARLYCEQKALGIEQEYGEFEIDCFDEPQQEYGQSPDEQTGADSQIDEVLSLKSTDKKWSRSTKKPGHSSFDGISTFAQQDAPKNSLLSLKAPDSTDPPNDKPVEQQKTSNTDSANNVVAVSPAVEQNVLDRKIA